MRAFSLAEIAQQSQRTTVITAMSEPTSSNNNNNTIISTKEYQPGPERQPSSSPPIKQNNDLEDVDLEEPSVPEYVATKEHIATTAQLCEYFAEISGGNQVDLRVQDFWTARFLRRNKYGNPLPARGVYELFQYLADLKLDLEWANEAAFRRKRNGSQTIVSTVSAATPYLSWTDFEAAHKQQWYVPYFSIVIMVLCTVSLIVSFALNHWKMEPLRVNPMVGPSVQVLIRMGALDSTLLVWEHKEWYRLLTAIIVHAGFIHYAVNMFVLWFLGRAVERVHGSIMTAVVFIVSAVGGNVASALFMPDAISVGASGGLFSLVGICLADICVNWDLITLRDPQKQEHGFQYGWIIFWLAFDIAIMVVFGLIPYIDNFAHLGGLLYALGLGLPLMEKYGSSGFFGHHRKRTCCRVTRIIILLLAVVLYVTTTLLLFTQDQRLDKGGRPKPVCHGCRHMSCAPFPFWTEDKWWHCDSCDRVEANLRFLGDSTQLEIMCPYSDNFTLAYEGMLDQELLRRQLPSLCRLHCTET